jgi:hypothetical protein
MAVLSRLNFSGSERLDLPDFLSLESFAAADWKYFLKSVAGGDRPYVIRGFDIIDAPNCIGAQSCSIAVANSIVYYPTADSGSFYYGLENDPPISPQLRNNAINYLYLTFTTTTTTPDTRAFWDPDQNSGAGQEFTQTVNTQEVLRVEVNVSTTGFPVNTVPLAQVTVGATSISAIVDCRNMLFRLGSGGLNPNPFNTYSFRPLPGPTYARQEPPISITSTTDPNPFQGGDKNIYSLKEWMDVVMTKLLELGGTSYWYQSSSSFSLINLFADALASTFKSKGQWQHSSVTPGLVTWSDDIVIKGTNNPRDIILRAGSATLADENVAYLPLLRNASINNANLEVSFVNGANYINTINGAIGLFANLNKGDFIKKQSDPSILFLRVQEFYDTENATGVITTPALAKSVLLSAAYTGASGNAVAVFDKGIYLASDVVVQSRNNVNIDAAGGNFHWLAQRSDIITNISNVTATTVTGTVSTTGGIATVVCSTPHGLNDGELIHVAAPIAATGNYRVEVQNATTFSFEPIAPANGAFTGYYGVVTTAQRATAYGTVLETAAHGAGDGDTLILSGTVNFNGSYVVKPRSATIAQFAISSAPAPETVGNCRLVRINVRAEQGIIRLVQGESLNISDTVAASIQQFVGMGGSAQISPVYSVPSNFSAIKGQENYSSTIGENLTARVAKLTAMMANNAQNKNIKFLQTGVQKIQKTTNGANQDIVFVGTPTPTLVIAQPSGRAITNGNTIRLELTLSGTLSLPQNSCAHVSLNRNADTTIANLAGVSVSPINEVPLDENTFVIAIRPNSTTDVWLWDGFRLSQSVNYYNMGNEAMRDLREDRSAFLSSASPVSWSGTQLTFANDIVLRIYNTLTGTLSTHTVQASQSPLSLGNGDIAYVEIDRNVTSENLTPTIASSLPAQTNANKDIIPLFIRIGSELWVPLHKQLIFSGTAVKLGTAPGSTGNRAYPNIFLSPLGFGDVTTLSAALAALPPSGGIILTLDDVTLTSNITLGDNVQIIGRNRSVTYNLGSGGGLTVNGDNVKFSDIRFNSSQTGITYVTVNGNDFKMENCLFDTSSDTNNNNYVVVAGQRSDHKNCIFKRVLLPANNDAITYQAGSVDNTYYSPTLT